MKTGIRVSLKRIAATVLIAAVSVSVSRAVGPQPGSAEYRLKAAFLLNFARFIEWPPDVEADKDSPLVIGVLGADPFGAVLDETISGEQVRGRVLAVRRASRVEDLAGCQILFISESERKRMKQILAEVSPDGLLTISEAEGFNELGGMIALAVSDQRIRFSINQGSAERASLKVSSKLLRLATQVTSPADGGRL